MTTATTDTATVRYKHVFNATTLVDASVFSGDTRGPTPRLLEALNDAQARVQDAAFAPAPDVGALAAWLDSDAIDWDAVERGDAWAD